MPARACFFRTSYGELFLLNLSQSAGRFTETRPRNRWKTGSSHDWESLPRGSSAERLAIIGIRMTCREESLRC